MEKLSMGEYGMIVWGAYATAFVLLLGIAWISVRAQKRTNKRFNELNEQKRETA